MRAGAVGQSGAARECWPVGKPGTVRETHQETSKYNCAMSQAGGERL